ncbi:response regulator transcription factor [Pantoea sp. GbtcB22]|uniref:response regulator transcription factor n=1 Tax=Pantoea sp. GbtcB22 TaxID=2824767 RepID=UPI001C311B33|nr:response regulator transcription factor [Pantoea sp. GbtcB22]
MTKIIIIDDHPLIARGITILMEGEPVTVVGCYTRAEKAFEAIIRDTPDIIITDLNLPDYHGTEVIRILKSLNIMSKVIVLTNSKDAVCIAECRALGVSAYVHKSQLSDELKKAILDVSKVACPPLSVSSVLSSIEHSVPLIASRRNILTAKEREVLLALSTGRTNKTVANDLMISEKTVSTHKQNIIRKLGAGNLLQALKIAHEMKIW